MIRHTDSRADFRIHVLLRRLGHAAPRVRENAAQAMLGQGELAIRVLDAMARQPVKANKALLQLAPIALTGASPLLALDAFWWLAGGDIWFLLIPQAVFGAILAACAVLSLGLNRLLHPRRRNLVRALALFDDPAVLAPLLRVLSRTTRSGRFVSLEEREIGRGHVLRLLEGLAPAEALSAVASHRKWFYLPLAEEPGTSSERKWFAPLAKFACRTQDVEALPLLESAAAGLDHDLDPATRTALADGAAVLRAAAERRAAADRLLRASELGHDNLLRVPEAARSASPRRLLRVPGGQGEEDGLDEFSEITSTLAVLRVAQEKVWCQAFLALVAATVLLPAALRIGPAFALYAVAALGVAVAAGIVMAVLTARKQRRLERRLIQMKDPRGAGPLLEALSTARGRHRRDVINGLTMLLPRLSLDQGRALTTGQRSAMRTALLQAESVPLCLAILEAYAACGDRAARGLVRVLANGTLTHTRDRRIQEAALRCLPALDARIAEDERVGIAVSGLEAEDREARGAAAALSLSTLLPLDRGGH